MSKQAQQPAAPKKSGKVKSTKVMTAKEKSREEEHKKIEKSWNGQPLEFVKVLGDGADAVAVGVRLAAAGKKSLVFAVREQVLGPGIGGDEFGEEDVARVVRHLKNHRRFSEHPFVVPLLAWTVVERNKEPVLLMAFPLCQTSLSKLLKEGGGKLSEDHMPYEKLWLGQVAITVGDMHEAKVIHGDLHAGNVLFDKVDGFLQPQLADFGNSVGYSDPEQDGATDGTLDGDSVLDVRSLGQLHCQMKHGKIELDAAALKALKEKDPDEYRMVVTLSKGHLPARQVVLMPWLQGPKKARQHPQFAHDLAAKYPDHPLAKVSGATLMKKFKDGNRGLRLRDEASADEVLQLKAHEEGELVMCLSPFGVLCKTKGAGHDCPPGGLWSVEQFRLHQHAGKTVLKENEKEAALELVKEKGKSKEEYERQQELLEALISTQYTGDPSLVYSTRIVFCPTHKRWANAILTNDGYDRWSFQHKCVVSSSCQEVLEPCVYPMHLGELVESTRPQAWSDAWTSLFTAARTQRNLEDMPIVQQLRDHGIVWQEPTSAAIVNAIADALNKPLEVVFEQLSTSTGSEDEKSRKKPSPKRSPRNSGCSGKSASKRSSSKR